MEKYHKYVFNTGERRLVGDFEEMYQAEDREEFDSWHSHDTRALRYQISLALLRDYNFLRILEVGCGKGTAAQFLKKKNNRVVGIDISPTAVSKAKASFPDIEFRCMDARNIQSFAEQFDLIGFQAVLAYIEEWRDILSKAADMTEFCLVAEYVPHHAIGMVKTIDDLVNEFSRHFQVVRKVVLDDEAVVLFGRSLKY